MGIDRSVADNYPQPRAQRAPPVIGRDSAVSGAVWQKQIGEYVVRQVLRRKTCAIKEADKVTDETFISGLQRLPGNPDVFG